MKWSAGMPYKVILFYRYVHVESPQDLCNSMIALCEQLGMLGRILIAREGVNGTLAGSFAAIDEFIKVFEEDPRFNKIDWKFSVVDSGAEQLPFRYLSIREEPEILSSGRVKDFINNHIEFSDDTFGGIVGTGQHLSPGQFHENLKSLSSSERVLLDVRNQFEYDIGHFDNAKSLNCATYSESWQNIDKILEREVPEKPIYMYCTGGIRCEKASAYLIAKGFKNVFQLQGGIHRYLEEYPTGGLFKGKNFVFDSRVAVKPQDHEQQQQQQQLPYNNIEAADGCSTSRGAKGLQQEHTSLQQQQEVKEQAGQEEEVEVEVVGQCIDCSSPYDTFSGSKMCTVCRLPVLVCPSCVTSVCVPGEYHCYRHRHLKHVYFTVLERFTERELQAQSDALLAMEMELLVDKRKAKGRRKTLRKQREKIEARLTILKTEGRRSSANTVTIIDEPPVVTSLHSSVSGDDHAVIRASNNNTDHGNDNIALSEMTILPLNPKTRVGWGFWQS